MAGTPAAIADIGANRVVEQHDVLTDQRDRIPERRQRHAGDIHAVDGDGARVHVIKPRDEIEDRGLAGAGRTTSAVVLPAAAVKLTPASTSASSAP